MLWMPKPFLLSLKSDIHDPGQLSCPSRLVQVNQIFVKLSKPVLKEQIHSSGSNSAEIQFLAGTQTARKCFCCFGTKKSGPMSQCQSFRHHTKSPQISVSNIKGDISCLPLSCKSRISVKGSLFLRCSNSHPWNSDSLLSTTQAKRRCFRLLWRPSNLETPNCHLMTLHWTWYDKSVFLCCNARQRNVMTQAPYQVWNNEVDVPQKEEAELRHRQKRTTWR